MCGSSIPTIRLPPLSLARCRHNIDWLCWFSFAAAITMQWDFSPSPGIEHTRSRRIGSSTRTKRLLCTAYPPLPSKWRGIHQSTKFLRESSSRWRITFVRIFWIRIPFWLTYTWRLRIHLFCFLLPFQVLRMYLSPLFLFYFLVGFFRLFSVLLCRSVRLYILLLYLTLSDVPTKRWW